MLMAPPLAYVEVKVNIMGEEDDSVQTVPDDESMTTTTARPTTTTDEINENDLMPLTTGQSSQVPYPPGCPVWYDLRPRRRTSSPGRLDARRGTIGAAYLDLKSHLKQFVYKVTKTNDDDDARGSPTEEDEGAEQFVSEDGLVYAANCPVLVRGMVKNDPNEELEGRILCPAPAGAGNKKSYAILFRSEGNRVRMEAGVDPERVSYDRRSDRRDSEERTTEGERGVPDIAGPGRRHASTGRERSPDALAELRRRLADVARDRDAALTERDASVQKSRRYKQEKETLTGEVRTLEGEIQLSLKVVQEAQELSAGKEDEANGLRRRLKEREALLASKEDHIEELSFAAESKEEEWAATLATVEHQRALDVGRVTAELNQAHSNEIEKVGLSGGVGGANGDAADGTHQEKSANGGEEKSRAASVAGAAGDADRRDSPSKGARPNEMQFEMQSDSRAGSASARGQGGAYKSRWAAAQVDRPEGSDPASSRSSKPVVRKPGVEEKSRVASVAGAAVDADRHDSSPKGARPNEMQSDSRAGSASALGQGHAYKSRWAAAQADRPEGSDPASPRSSKPVVRKPESREVYRRLTVPSWVTNCTTKNLLSHISIGKQHISNGKQVGTLRYERIESETGCIVNVSQADESSRTPMRITLRPSHPDRRYDIDKAREMVEDALLEFLECDGARARLLYELAATLDGPSGTRPAGGGAVRQRSPRTGESVWMDLLDLPAFDDDDLLAFEADVRRRTGYSPHCSVEIFGRCFGNTKLPVRFCRPFALIYSSSRSGHVEWGRNMVKSVIKQYQQCDENALADSYHENESRHVFTKASMPTGSGSDQREGRDPALVTEQSLKPSSQEYINNEQQSAQPVTVGKSDSTSSPKSFLPEKKERSNCAPDLSTYQHAPVAAKQPTVASFTTKPNEQPSGPNPSTLPMPPSSAGDTLPSKSEQKPDLSRRRWEPPSGKMQEQKSASQASLQSRQNAQGQQSSCRDSSQSRQPQSLSESDKKGGHIPVLVSSRKRKSTSDKESLPAHPKGGDSSGSPTQLPTKLKTSTLYTLAVPSWVTQTHSLGNKLLGKYLANKLLAHILGTDNGTYGHKTKKITLVTNCHICYDKGRNGQPTKITITSGRRGGDTSRAKIMIEKSLLDFLEDESSKGRLRCELAGCWCVHFGKIQNQQSTRP